MPDDNEIRVSLGPVEVPEHLRAQYANFVNVNHTPWDFRLVFAVVKAPMPGHEQEGITEGAIHPSAVAEVILPANLIHGLISALRDNFDRYIQDYGAPGLEPEGPRPPEDHES